MKTRTTVVAALLSIAAFGAFAQAEMPKVDQRQDKQQARIGAGVASGQLTPKETVKLEAGQARVENAEKRAEADGTVTKAEKAKLSHLQNKQSRKIKRQKHDAQKAG